jgi:DNA-directed RNA polymerase subunit alpha
VEIINKDLEIARLESGGEIRMTIEISKGKGYGEDTDKGARPAGFMPIDAIFTPILKVHYDVEPARVGQKTDYDKLIIEITTDGTLEPKKALHRAAIKLQEALRIFTIEGEEPREDAAQSPSEQPSVSLGDKDYVLDQAVDFIELSSRSVNCLKAEGIKTVRDLVRKTENELKMVKNFGAQSMKEVKEKLTEMNLSLGMSAAK